MSFFSCKNKTTAIDAAAEKCAAVHELFQSAKTSLDEANGILDEFVATTTAQIQDLQAEVIEAGQDRVTNANLAAKLAEFTA
jgi:hypothetical protein